MWPVVGEVILNVTLKLWFIKEREKIKLGFIKIKKSFAL